MIIALIGEKLAGKDTVAEYLIEQHGAHHVKFSQILDEVLYVLNLEISRDNEIALVTALRSAFGNDVLMKSLVKKAKDTTVPIILINGVRYPEELESLKKLKAKLIYITAPLDLRYQSSTKMRDAVFGNVGTIMSFKIGAEDAEYMAKEMAPVLSEQDVIGIPNFSCYVKLNVNNTTSRPFSMATYYDESQRNEKLGALVKEYSRMKSKIRE
jgi:hypothetical protein